jgi:hypothetical protein
MEEDKRGALPGLPVRDRVALDVREILLRVSDPTCNRSPAALLPIVVAGASAGRTQLKAEDLPGMRVSGASRTGRRSDT